MEQNVRKRGVGMGASLQEKGKHFRYRRTSLLYEGGLVFKGRHRGVGQKKEHAVGSQQEAGATARETGGCRFRWAFGRQMAHLVTVFGTA
jgi:hypothetical protein